MTTDDSSVPAKRTLAGVVANFINGLDARLEAMETALNGEDWEELTMLSHKLAGAALFGFPVLGEVAHQLEKVVKAENFKEIPALIEALKLESRKCGEQTSL